MLLIIIHTTAKAKNTLFESRVKTPTEEAPAMRGKREANFCRPAALAPCSTAFHCFPVIVRP